MELLWLGDLRRVAKRGEGVKSRVGDLGCHSRAESSKVAQLSGDIGRRPLLSDGGVVLLADHEQSAGLDKRELIADGLREDEVDDLSLVERVGVGLGTLVDVDQHVDPGVVLVLPLSDVVGRLLVSLDRGVGAGSLRHVVVVDGQVGDAERLVVFEADGVDEDHLIDLVGEHQSVTGGEHTAEGVAHDGSALDAKGLQEAVGVGRELLQRELVALRLG